MSRRSKTLDAFPNYLSSAITMSAANTFTTQTLALPIPRIGSTTRPTIMEFLYILVQIDGTDLIANGDDVSFSIRQGGVPTGVGNYSSSDVIAHLKLENALVTSGMQLRPTPIKIDMETKSGYGQLVASDTVHVSMASTGQAGACIANFRIYYRFVQVPVTEYVGIVQSGT